MLKAKDLVRIRHMLDAAEKAVDLAEGCTRRDLEVDEKAALALVRLLEILGEAAKNVSPECRLEYTSIPWRQIAGTRDRLIHGYFDVDLNVVWQIVSSDAPPLVVQLREIIRGAENSRE